MAFFMHNYQTSVYINPSGETAVLCNSVLYNIVRQDLHFLKLEQLAIDEGMSHMSAKGATDERLVYFIAKKRGLIQ